MRVREAPRVDANGHMISLTDVAEAPVEGTDDSGGLLAVVEPGLHGVLRTAHRYCYGFDVIAHSRQPEQRGGAGAQVSSGRDR